MDSILEVSGTEHNFGVAFIKKTITQPLKHIKLIITIVFSIRNSIIPVNLKNQQKIY